jgi:SSS family solute:Na+ symporter
MNPQMVIGVFLAYVFTLLGIARWTNRKTRKGDDSQHFFAANNSAPWYAVAFGMLGASLSGVTFISVPGWVESQGFTYMQMVFGYLIGYGFIMAVLMPLYYRMGLTSIYGYFAQRFGARAYKTGASFFILSRLIGASFRLFLVALVLDLFVLQPLGWDIHLQVMSWANIPVGYSAAVALILAVIWSYTRQGGLGTIVWTDTLQTAAMLIAVIYSGHAIVDALDWSWSEIPSRIAASPFNDWVVWDDWKASNHLVKHLLAGAFVATAMTGMDQDMMQKNLACRNLQEARWNMGSFSIVLVFVNVLFLALGALLYSWIEMEGISIESADSLYPTVALDGGLGIGLGLIFLIGLLASAFSSADSALTALTTSVCVDLLGTEGMPSAQATKRRKQVHLGMTFALFGVIMAFSSANDTSVVAAIFTAANYTYGPILGLFAFGLATSLKPIDRFIPIVAIFAPVICYGFESYLVSAHEFSFGFALLPVNGLITFIGLGALSFASSKK